jgi:hypothetical protein
MSNPFEYGVAVTGTAFCNRTAETADLLNTIENSARAFLYSERRMGKTSLVLRAIKNLDPERSVAAYVDLWTTDDEASFVTATAKGISQAMGTTADRVLAAAMRFFARMAPSVSLDESGQPKISFEYNPSAAPTKRDLEDVLSVPARIAKESGRKVVIVFDEVQRILEYETDHVERLLRSIIQHQNNVAYIFLGSQRHVVNEMFLNRRRPLFGSADHFPVGPIDVKHWRPFIRRKFVDSNKHIDGAVIDRICEITEGHPFYTQHLCHAIWERCEPGKSVNADDIRTGVQTLLARESYAYSALWETLTTNQRRLMRGLAIEGRNAALYSSSFAQKYGIGTPSAVQRMLGILTKRDLIDREDRSVFILDRFFRIWIREREE